MKFFSCLSALFLCALLSASVAFAKDVPSTQPQHAQICIIGESAAGQDVASLVQSFVSSTETLKPDQATALRNDMSKAKDLGYTYIMTVAATYSSDICPYAKEDRIFKAALTFKVYDPARSVVIKTWRRQGLAIGDAAMSSTDETECSHALADAADNAHDLPLDDLK